MQAPLRDLLRRLLVAGCAALLLGFGGAGAALAGFSARPNAATRVTAATLQPPVDLVATCRKGFSSNTVTLRWVATSSPFATGNGLDYTANSSAKSVAISGRTSTTWSATGDPFTSTTYAFTLVSVAGRWTSHPATTTIRC